MNKIKFTSYLFEIHFNITLPPTPRPSKWYRCFTLSKIKKVCNQNCESSASSCLNTFWKKNFDRTWYSHVILRTYSFICF